MVETVEPSLISSSSANVGERMNLPVIFIEDRDDEVNGQIMSVLDSSADHYAPSVRNVYVAKPIDTKSGFGFHLSRSKWDPYPYISRIDKDSFAASSGLKEGDCVLEVDKQETEKQ